MNVICEKKSITLEGDAEYINNENEVVYRFIRIRCGLSGDAASLKNFHVLLVLEREVEALNISVVADIENPNPARRVWRWDVAGIRGGPLLAECVASSEESYHMTQRAARYPINYIFSIF